ncbi:hypothetical protein [Allobaculum sp. Allo2]|uniref:hypothetical protein n=1 Tax=Allobaculum sp. Allo2 TaxID=2853432 RepID=UPI001F61EFAD|nr:hypothetical protein [Allobaculum sp. Allo2]UNT93725.1 hypothetical protein KWG61_02990 [Allobaculum sp. Allo2]
MDALKNYKDLCSGILFSLSYGALTDSRFKDDPSTERSESVQARRKQKTDAALRLCGIRFSCEIFGVFNLVSESGTGV